MKTKEFKTIEEQIKLLEKRKLKFKNRERAAKILLKYNYFDVVNGFESIFLKAGTKEKEYMGAYFEDFYDLYKFDMRLKKNTLSSIFDIEARLRTSIAYHFAGHHCATPKKTLNYLKRDFYQRPTGANAHLENVFKRFRLFKKGHLAKQKREYDYIKQYGEPPFWVMIKTMPFGTLYYLFVFLDNETKQMVLSNFGLGIDDEQAFVQALNILKKLRNQCAHLELISRFRQKRNQQLNCFAEITELAGLSPTDIFFLDAIKIIRRFSPIRNVKCSIVLFYVKMTLKGRRQVAKKILGKMGRKNLFVWLRL